MSQSVSEDARNRRGKKKRRKSGSFEELLNVSEIIITIIKWQFFFAVASIREMAHDNDGNFLSIKWLNGFEVILKCASVFFAPCSGNGTRFINKQVF